MRGTGTIELVGIGEVKTYPIKTIPIEFPRVNKDGKEVKRKTEKTGTSKTFYEDDEGNRYDESEVFYLVGKKIISKVKRTEKISDFKVCDKMEIFDFMSDSYSVLDYNTTTQKNFEKIAKDNAIKFKIKSSSIGMKWDIAYVFKFNGHLVMFKGMGKISDGLKEFADMKQAESKSKTIKEEITIKAEDLNKEIEGIITI